MLVSLLFLVILVVDIKIVISFSAGQSRQVLRQCFLSVGGSLIPIFNFVRHINKRRLWAMIQNLAAFVFFHANIFVFPTSWGVSLAIK